MIGQKITIKNRQTGQEIVINDHNDPNNVIALQSYPNFERIIRNQNVPRSGSHGEFALPRYYGAMSITLQGIIVGDTESDVWDIKRNLDEILNLPNSGRGVETGYTKIDEVIAENICTNPNGANNVDDWEGIDANLSHTGKINVETTEDTEAGLKHVSGLVQQGNRLVASCLVENLANSERKFRIKLESRDNGENILNSNQEDFDINDRGTLTVDLEIPADVEDVVLTITRLADDAESGDTFEVSKVGIIKNAPEQMEGLYFDGDLEFPTFTFEWTGTPQNSTTEAYLNELPSVRKETLRISFEDPKGDEIFIDATPLRVDSYNRNLMETFRLDFQFILRASFPYKIIRGIPTVISGELGSITYGFKLPTEIPFSISKEVENLIVINVDNISFPTFKINGSDQGIISNPKIINLTTGQEVRIMKTLSGSNDFIIIDGYLKKVTDKNGNDITSFLQGGFMELAKGENTLIYTE